MAIGVRDYLENLGHTVGYDKRTGDVLVKNKKGKMTSIGSAGFTLNDDGRYYAESEGDILSALSKSGISAKPGYSPVRNALSGANSIGYNDKTGQLYVNGRDYNVDGTNLVKIGDKIYGEDKFLQSISKKEYENSFEDLQKDVLEKIINNSYGGYNPQNDAHYQAAQEDFVKKAKEDMGKRGLVSDSLATHYAAQGAEKLMPAFAEMDFEKYKYDNENLKDALEIMGNLDENAREAYKTNADSTYKDNALMHQREKDIADILKAEAKEQKEDERLYEKHKNEMEILESEQNFKREMEAAGFEYDKEIERLKNDLGMSRDEAKAYLKLIYG